MEYASDRGVVNLSVPVYQCSHLLGGCGRTFHQHPSMIGCFPASPSAMDLDTAKKPVWLDLLMLKKNAKLWAFNAASEEGMARAVSEVLEDVALLDSDDSSDDEDQARDTGRPASMCAALCPAACGNREGLPSGAVGLEAAAVASAAAATTAAQGATRRPSQH